MHDAEGGAPQGRRRYDVITLFPEMFAALTGSGITRRARDRGLYRLGFHNPRDFATGAHRTVDDRPYGGGPGMVMLAEPLRQAIAQARGVQQAALGRCGRVIYLSPQGRRLDHARVVELAREPGLVLLCGRYEGIDQRFLDRHVDVELSLGDFVLSGGELPALALLDAVARLQEGVLGDEQSHQQDSFSEGLLDCPHYSRPEVLSRAEGPDAVPPVLLSGHHAEIARWRRERSLEIGALVDGAVHVDNQRGDRLADELARCAVKERGLGRGHRTLRAAAERVCRQRSCQSEDGALIGERRCRAGSAEALLEGKSDVERANVGDAESVRERLRQLVATRNAHDDVAAAEGERIFGSRD